MNEILNKKWSRRYDKCIGCGTNEKKYSGRGFCKNCYEKGFTRNAHRIYQNEWRKRNPEKHKENQRKEKLKRVHGITIEEYDLMLKNQSGRCAICFNVPTFRRLDIDHDHVTGKNRELLCSACNKTLGIVNDSIQLLEKMIVYLKKHGR